MTLRFNNSLFQPGMTIVVGLSGGPDSVCLLHYLVAQRKRLGLEVVAAHLDHEWRKDAQQDTLFCRKLCEDLSVPFFTKKASELNFTRKDDGSQESKGRHLRRHFLETVAQRFDSAQIALAHHAQDQVETFFIRLIRGATITGLGCMKPQDGIYLRPLLETDKSDIFSYLDQNLLAYRHDPTNESLNFLRNRIRKELIPALQSCDERSEPQILRAIEHFQQTEQFLTEITNNTCKEVIENSVLDLALFRSLAPFLQRRIIIQWLCTEKATFTLSTNLLDEILRFLKHERGGRHQLGINWQLVKQGTKVFFVKN